MCFTTADFQPFDAHSLTVRLFHGNWKACRYSRGGVLELYFPFPRLVIVGEGEPQRPYSSINLQEPSQGDKLFTVWTSDGDSQKVQLVFPYLPVRYQLNLKLQIVAPSTLR